MNDDRKVERLNATKLTRNVVEFQFRVVANCFNKDVISSNHESTICTMTRCCWFNKNYLLIKIANYECEKEIRATLIMVKQSKSFVVVEKL